MLFRSLFTINLSSALMADSNPLAEKLIIVNAAMIWPASSIGSRFIFIPPGDRVSPSELLEHVEGGTYGAVKLAVFQPAKSVDALPCKVQFGDDVHLQSPHQIANPQVQHRQERDDGDKFDQCHDCSASELHVSNSPLQCE